MKARNIIMILVACWASGCASLPDKKEIAIEKIKMAYACKGNGGPAVILEAGLGGGMDTWAPVFESVAAFTTVFAYDRSGYEESGKPADAPKTSGGTEIAREVGVTILDIAVPGAGTVMTIGTMAAQDEDDSPRTGAVIVAELHETLKKVGIAPPYVLVGHSLGGLYTSLFARLYPEEVAGLVWVDSMHPEQIQRCKEYLPAKQCDPECYPWWVKTLIKLAPGVLRAEMAGMPETGRQIRAAGALPQVPLIVISHGKPPADKSDMERMWAALQQDLAGESTCCAHLIARNSGHNIQHDEPNLVINSIKDLVMQARGGGLSHARRVGE